MLRPPVILCLLFAEAATAGTGYPPEVERYIERREVCEHFRQEPWPEGSAADQRERRKFIASQFQRYCKGTDRAIQALKQKYEGNPAVMDRLNKYEFPIEAKP